MHNYASSYPWIHCRKVYAFLQPDDKPSIVYFTKKHTAIVVAWVIIHNIYSNGLAISTI